MKLSVLMLAYNHERYIAQAIQSALDQQTGFDFEIVIGEDCSTDRTRDIITDFCRRYPDRIRPLFRKTNLGMARNFVDTFHACKGDYIASLEGDDYWTCPDKLQRQVDFLDTHPDFAICCGRARVLDEVGISASDVWPPDKAGGYTITDLLQNNFICTLTGVYRRKVLGTLPKWFETLMPSDWPLHAMVAQFGKIELTNDLFGVYRMHQGGVWTSRSQVKRTKNLIAMFVALNRGLEYCYNETIQNTLAKLHSDWAGIAWETGSRREATACLVNGLRTGTYRAPAARPIMRGLAGFALFGSWLHVLSKLKRSIRTPARRSD